MFKKIIPALALAALAVLAIPQARAADEAISGNLRLACGTASATAGAATLANKCGVITSEALTTAAGSTYTLTLTNTVAAAADIVVWAVDNGTNTGGAPAPQRATPGSGTIAFTVKNLTDGANGTPSALNGTIKIRYLLLKP